MAIESVVLPAGAMPDIRKALAYGLAAIGEIERLQNLQALEEMGGKPWPREHSAISPGDACVITDFADALIWLDCAQPAESVR